MLEDGRLIDNDTVVVGDICILGAGAAGISIAHEFLEENHKVILIESGGLEFDDATQALYDGEDEALGMGDSRSRYFGGSTNCWHGVCGPLDNADFAAKEWVPESGWPISRKDLVPYYEKASTLLGIGPFKQFLDMDWDRNIFPGQFFKNLKSPDSKISGAPFIQSVDPNLRFGSMFMPVLKKAKNIHVFLNSNIIELSSNVSGGRISAVQIATLSGKKFTVKAKKYVLALGGIENPRVLLASNSVEQNGIGNRSDNVGRYFMGHPMLRAGEILYPDDKFCFDKEIIDAPRGLMFFKLQEKIQKEEQLLNVGIEFRREMSKAEMAFRVFRRNILQGQFSRDLGENILQMSENLSAVAHAVTCNIQGKRKRANKWGLFVQAEEPPNRENRVMLGHKKDALGMNMLNARRPQSAQSRKTVLRTVEIFAAELMRFELGRTRLDGGHLESRLFTDDGSQGLHFGHDMGTTRMSNDPSKGVVDKDCRVHSAKNLYIAGSSVFSTSGFANPTYTIMALALRIAEHIKMELSHETVLSD